MKNKFSKPKLKVSAWARLLSGALLLVAFCLQPAFSQTGKYEQIVFGCYTDDINDFEQFVA